MSEYKKILVRGTPRYMQDGKFVKAETIPEEELTKLDTPEALPVSDEPEVRLDKQCIFCGTPSNWSRYVNGQTVAICQDHYYSMTVGKVAAKLREVSDEGDVQTKEVGEEN